jgi:glutathione peroxidase-family protein
LVANIDSECGYMPLPIAIGKQLPDLYEEFRDKLTIVGFPADSR